jgi:type II secretory pathway pseudopilin PulG
MKRSNDGYTLLETLVAMTLFLSVLIPMLTTIGSFMFSGSVDKLNVALREAETEIAEVYDQRDFHDVDRTLANGLELVRTVAKSEIMVTVRVRVTSSKSAKPILILEKTFITQ